MATVPQRIPDVPFLPGNTFVDPTVTSYKKSQVFDFKASMRVVHDDKPLVGPAPRPDMPPNPRLTATAQSLLLTQTRKPGLDSEQEQENLPSWVAFDKKVLRFDAYFKESVNESNAENYRVRKCVIYYYLEDDSIHVAEPRKENSGIPQGVFLKRHRIPKTPTDFYTVMDLNLGFDVTFYGRTFHITNCDPFTRNFYEKLGVELNYPEDEPGDPYQTIRTTMTAKLKGPAGGPPKPKNDDLTRFVEARLGKATNVLEEDTLEQFLKNDRKVLRFSAVWDDREALYGEKRQFILHYYLADDTVEVLECRKANNGRDPFPLLLKRGRLPKDPNCARVSQETGEAEFSAPGQSKLQAGYYKDIDFRIGGVIWVYGRRFIIFDCDKFSKDYYTKTYGITDFSPITVVEEEPAPPVMDRPPYNGFGSEEDSLGSFLYLIPKVPKKDWVRLMENDRKILRFTARMVTQAPEDIDRRFIVSYYLADNSISVYEPPRKNSGIIGGKFLERGRVRLPSNPEDYYEVRFFTVGAQLEFYRHKFLLMEADDYTLRYQELNARFFPQADPRRYNDRLRQLFASLPKDVETAFRQVDMNSDAFVDKSEVRYAAHNSNIEFTEQELASLMYHYDIDGDGRWSMQEFIDAVSQCERGTSAA